MTTSDLQPGPEADAAVAQAMGDDLYPVVYIEANLMHGYQRDTLGSLTWESWWYGAPAVYTPKMLERKPRPYTTDDRWVSPMVLRLRELCNPVKVCADEYGWEVTGILRHDDWRKRQKFIERATDLREAVWRCLLACYSKPEEV